MGAAVPKGTAVPVTCAPDFEEQRVGPADVVAVVLGAAPSWLDELQPVSASEPAHATTASSVRERGCERRASADTRHSVANSGNRWRTSTIGGRAYP
ncbi:hypothetical protein GCM10011492_02040 [Flexivirga endophytica]|uniref:Uncharacterized protein n=1 Tax=Flexivirga endophytica TaxID=1849103 RepID=A0A916SVE6_9MICO|nr:hypothetical protein GCM10011492_02040 [Flexivirga endophytica]GHB39677.1 hypothetical protein GCM10008112_05570 [Flexivirga endophytica]